MSTATNKYADVPHIETEGANSKKLSDKHLALVRRGAELTRQMKDSKTELDKINGQLKKDIGPGVSLVLPTEFRVPIAESISYSIKDVDGLREHLGTRKFNQLVAREEKFKPSTELLAMGHVSEPVSDCLSERKSVSVKYLPIKTQK